MRNIRHTGDDRSWPRKRSSMTSQTLLGKVKKCGGKQTVLSSKLFDDPKFRPNEPKFRVSFYKIHILPCQASCFQKSRPIVPQSFYIDMDSLLQKSPQQSPLSKTSKMQYLSPYHLSSILTMYDIK